MNLPNKLTFLRIILVPVFLIIFNLGYLWIAGVVFVIASLTDLADGKIARKYNLVTNSGKFTDPLADKLLACAATMCRVETGKIPSWVVIIIISREFIISGFRLIASDNGVVIAASYWGKFKTVFQMVMIILMIADIAAISVVTQVVMWIALILTVVSLVDYLKKNWHVMGEQK